MEVILLEDVRTLGKKGQIVKINDGYARNYVIPKKLGIEATPKNLNDLKLQKKREEKEAAEELAMAKELAATIEDKSVTVYLKTGEGGRTFGTISTKEVAAAVKEQLGLEVDKKKMKLDEPIKTLGTHIIALEAEQSVIGSMIWDRQAIFTAVEMHMQDDFYYKQYGIMFQAMVEMNNEGKPVDVVTLQV